MVNLITNMLLTLVVLLTFTVSGNSGSNEAVFRVEQENMGARLDGHMIVELSNDNLMLDKCALLCKQLTNCKSVNFGRVHRLCQLNSATKAEVESSDFQVNSTFVYIDMASWPTRNSDPCSSKPCTGNDRCLATGGSYECYSTDCTDPLISVNGSTIEAGSNAIGSIRKYVCPAKQLTQGTDTITCSFSGWSTPSVTCEYVRSCSDIQTCDPSYIDDEYWLYPAPYGSRRTKVYCDGLSGSTPKEYISVNSGENYGYDSLSSMTRYFSKIRVDIETMVVDRNDKTFTTDSGSGGDPKYGNGKGCACVGCTTGSFKIDTSGTGLIFDPSLTWTYYGYGQNMANFARTNGGAVISANCGGYCGDCEADGSMTLQLNPNDDVSEEEAVIPVCLA